MSCFIKEVNKTFPGAKFIGDVASDLDKEEMV
jgi:hypothetical protein